MYCKKCNGNLFLNVRDNKSGYINVEKLFLIGSGPHRI